MVDDGEFVMMIKSFCNNISNSRGVKRRCCFNFLVLLMMVEEVRNGGTVVWVIQYFLEYSIIGQYQCV